MDVGLSSARGSEMGRRIPWPWEKKQNRVNEKENGEGGTQLEDQSPSGRSARSLLSSRRGVLPESRIESLARDPRAYGGVAERVGGDAIGSVSIEFCRAHEDTLSVSRGVLFLDRHPPCLVSDVCPPNAPAKPQRAI